MAIDYFKKREIIVSNAEIQSLCQKLADQINNDYKDKELVLVGLMNGSMIFLADIITRLTIDVEIEPLKIYTYSKVEEKKIDTKRIKQHFCWERLIGRDVLVLDELLDSGDTLDYITKKIKTKCHPSSLKVCCLLAKNRVRPFNVHIDYLGKLIPDRWITGYGMGYKYKYRNLRDIVILDDEDKNIKVRPIPCKK